MLNPINRLLFWWYLVACGFQAAAFPDDSLKNLVSHADIILRVRINNTSPDSLPYFVHNLETNYYTVRFKLEKVFRSNTTDMWKIQM